MTQSLPLPVSWALPGRPSRVENALSINTAKSSIHPWEEMDSALPIYLYLAYY